MWQTRVAWVTRGVRYALDKQGLPDAVFTLRQFVPGHVVVEDIRLGAPVPVLAIDRVEVRFSYRDLLRRQVERIDVRGVRTRLTVDNGKVISPVYERVRPLLETGAARPPTAGTGRFSLGAGSLRDVQVSVERADGGPLATWTFDAGLLAETPERYRVWCGLNDTNGLCLKADGTVDPDTGAVTLMPDVAIRDVGKLVEWARLMAPDRMARVTAFPTNCSLSVRGSVALRSWTHLGPFEVNAELGRGSVWTFAKKDAFVKFQSFRVEASGTPRDMQCRVSAGISGFSDGGQLQASQEEGRLLGLRGAARFRQTDTNQCVSATLDSDLPGRAVAKLLPRILPLVPVFFSDGGTLHVEAEAARLPQKAWNGQVGFKAEALRSSTPLTAGRLGAGAVRVSGVVALSDAKPGVLQTDVQIADGYFFRRNLSVRGGMDATLTSHPPYVAATGVFKGHVSESVALPQCNLSLGDGVVPFEGETVVTGLPSSPVWQVALRVPEFDVVSTQQMAEAQATVGAKASIRYGATNLAVEGDAWVRDVAVKMGPDSNRVGEAGVSWIAAQVKVPAFNPTLVSNANVDVKLNVSNGWARMGSVAVLEDARVAVPLTWSLAKGLSFLPEQRLTWRRLEAQGLKVEPDMFALSATNGTSVEARFGAHVAGSKAGVTVKAAVPLADPRQAVLDVTLPETEITADDALAAVVREKARGVEFSGRVAAEAQVVFWGTHPRIVGRVRLADGQVRKDQLAVEGLSADVPFQKGISFRTIERPVISFTQANAGRARNPHPDPPQRARE